MYEKFSAVYDKFIGIDYEAWVDYIEKLWDKFGEKPALVLDLACGTGNITILLALKGYDMIGLDNSAEMLSEARNKDSGAILFTLQDMRDFELYGTVDACICMVDSVNYIPEEEELLKVFSLVHNYLNPGGLFIFDINSEYKFRHILGDNSFCDSSPDAAVIWDNYYDEESRINEYYVNVFALEENGLYGRYEETHRQRAYKVEDIDRLLRRAGFEFLASYDALTFNEPHDESEKIFFVGRAIK